MNNYFIEPIITFFLPTSVAYLRLKDVHQVQLLEQSGKKTMHAFAGPVMTEILKHLDLHLTIITVNQQRPQQMWNTLHKESITNELLAWRLGNRAVSTQRQQEHHLPSWVLNPETVRWSIESLPCSSRMDFAICSEEQLKKLCLLPGSNWLLCVTKLLSLFMRLSTSRHDSCYFCKSILRVK